VIVVEVGSAFRVITGVTLTFFSCGVVIFFGGDFEVVDFFVTVVFAGVVDCAICFTHSRNVISSNAKSFPCTCVFTLTIEITAEVLLPEFHVV